MTITTHALGDGWSAEWKRDVNSAREQMTIFNGLGARIVLGADSLLRLRAIFVLADDLGPLVERVHEPIPADAIERYKGFVIRRDTSGDYVWQHGSPTGFDFVDDCRKDIDLYLAKVDTAGAGR